MKQIFEALCATSL